MFTAVASKVVASRCGAQRSSPLATVVPCPKHGQGSHEARRGLQKFHLGTSTQLAVCFQNVVELLRVGSGSVQELSSACGTGLCEGQSAACDSRPISLEIRFLALRVVPGSSNQDLRARLGKCRGPLRWITELTVEFAVCKYGSQVRAKSGTFGASPQRHTTGGSNERDRWGRRASTCVMHRRRRAQAAAQDRWAGRRKRTLHVDFRFIVALDRGIPPRDRPARLIIWPIASATLNVLGVNHGEGYIPSSWKARTQAQQVPSYSPGCRPALEQAVESHPGVEEDSLPGVTNLSEGLLLGP